MDRGIPCYQALKVGAGMHSGLPEKHCEDEGQGDVRSRLDVQIHDELQQYGGAEMPR